MTSKIIQIPQFIMPLEIERRFEVDDPRIVAYYVYWTPWGDECMVGCLYRDGTIIESDSDWSAFLELEKLNPIMQHYNLGSSDREAEYMLFVDKIHNKFYFVSRFTKKSDLFALIGLNNKNGE